MIDVAPSMHALLPEVEKVCCLLATKKVHATISAEYLLGIVVSAAVFFLKINNDFL